MTEGSLLSTQELQHSACGLSRDLPWCAISTQQSLFVHGPPPTMRSVLNRKTNKCEATLFTTILQSSKKRPAYILFL